MCVIVCFLSGWYILCVYDKINFKKCFSLDNDKCFSYIILISFAVVLMRYPFRDGFPNEQIRSDAKPFFLV